MIHEIVDNSPIAPVARRLSGTCSSNRASSTISNWPRRSMCSAARAAPGRDSHRIGVRHLARLGPRSGQPLGDGVRRSHAAPVDDIVAQRIPEEIARRYRAIPISEEGGVLRVAVADPTDVFALDDLQVITKAAVVPVVASTDPSSWTARTAFGTGRAWRAASATRSIPRSRRRACARRQNRRRTHHSAGRPRW